MSKDTDLKRVHWPTFSVAVRVCAAGHRYDHEDIAREAAVSAGAVARACQGRNVSEKTYAGLCKWMERDPQDFYDGACVFESRNADGSKPNASGGFGVSRTWCRTHGYDCPLIHRKPTTLLPQTGSFEQ